MTLPPPKHAAADPTPVGCARCSVPVLATATDGFDARARSMVKVPEQPDEFELQGVK
jgi:hypothetical protein